MIDITRVWSGFLLLLVEFASVAGSPVHYVENKNQWHPDFHFGADFPQMKVMLKDASIFFVQYSSIPDDDKSLKKLFTKDPNESHVHQAGDVSIATFELFFIDALHASINASGQQITKYNYYLGRDQSTHAGGLAAYSHVTYDGLYDGIDLKVYSENNQMKYDWIVAPCADVRKIRFMYRGAEHIELRNEDLVVEGKLGEIVETRPYAYQLVNGARQSVTTAFDIDDNVVSFVFPDGYDPNYGLVIDPFLVFSSYSGSTVDNWGNTATPDSKGNLYSGGMVSGEATGFLRQFGFPTTPGVFQRKHGGGDWDVGILKYDSSGANVLYVTYLGGDGVETPQSLVVNNNDELFVLGATSSGDFPKAMGHFKGGETVDPLGGVRYNGGTDIFIAKLAEDGSKLLAATYVGGTGNDGINFVSGDMDSQRIGKIESVLSRNYGDQLRGDIIADDHGNVYIASNTRSADFPVINSDAGANFHGGTHDAVVAKFDASLSMVWSRLIGGSNTDAAYSIQLASLGNIFVAGGTASSDISDMNGDLPSAPGGTDGWIMELSPSGDQVINGTFAGTLQYDQVYFIDLATNGDVLAYGQTMGKYPVTPAGVYANPNSGQFLHRFTPDLKTTIFSTTFGTGDASPNISPTAFLVSECDMIYMAGWGGTVNAMVRGNIIRNYVGGDTKGLDVTDNAWQKTTSGNDFYMMVLPADANKLLYATFLGGTASSTHVDGGTSRFDKRGVVYHAVCAGCGGRPHDFPSYNVPDDRSENRSDNCNNAAFKFDLSLLRAALQTNNFKLTQPGLAFACIPDPLVFQNVGFGGTTFRWDFGDGETQTVSDKNNIIHYYQKPGRYTVKMVAGDPSTCIGIDSVYTYVAVFERNMTVGPDLDICSGSSTKLSATGAVNYRWSTKDDAYFSNSSDPVIGPKDTTIYFLSMTDRNGCVQQDTVTVNVVPGVDLAFDVEKIYDCQSRPYVKVRNVSDLNQGEDYTFQFGDGESTTETDVVHTYAQDGIYTISLRAKKDFCTYEKSEELRFYTVKVPNVITPGSEDGLNDVFKVLYGDPPRPKEDVNIRLKVMNRWGVPVFESKDYRDDWNGAGIDEGIYYFEVEMDELKCKGWVHLIK